MHVLTGSAICSVSVLILSSFISTTLDLNIYSTQQVMKNQFKSCVKQLAMLFAEYYNGDEAIPFVHYVHIPR